MFETAVIAIGGKGTRLKGITGKVPKPLFPIQGKSTLFRICEELENFNFKEIILTLNNQIDLFEDEIKKIKTLIKMNFKINVEEEVLGECGALWNLENSLKEDFLFLNGDIIFSIDLNKLYQFHKEINSKLTLVSHTTSHPYDSDILSAPNGTLIQDIYPKSRKRDFNKIGYLGNAGISCISPSIIRTINKPIDIKKSSIFNHLVEESFKKGIRIFSYNTSEYIKDMGTPDRFNIVAKDIESNLIQRKNYIFKQRALFLDRDNTLIKCQEGEYILSIKDVNLLKDNVKKIAKISKKFNIVIIATNQPQISMGKLSISELDEINSHIITECIKLDLFIDDVIFCPHHPHGGYPGEITSLKSFCFCRKPNPGMFLQMSQRKNIDLKNSLLIGDSIFDRNAAKNAGMDFKDVRDI